MEKNEKQEEKSKNELMRELFSTASQILEIQMKEQNEKEEELQMQNDLTELEQLRAWKREREEKEETFEASSFEPALVIETASYRIAFTKDYDEYKYKKEADMKFDGNKLLIEDKKHGFSMPLNLEKSCNIKRDIEAYQAFVAAYYEMLRRFDAFTDDLCLKNLNVMELPQPFRLNEAKENDTNP